MSRPLPSRSFYLSSGGQDIHAHYVAAQGRLRAHILWLPPFAEEAHCARRHLVAAAREFAEGGYASLLIDPFGTGESAGEFAEADWDVWRGNALDALAWLSAQAPVPVWVAGLRAGVLLAADVVSCLDASQPAAGMLWWQPVEQGRQTLDNFLRMQLAVGWAEDAAASAGSILADLRDQLAAGEAVEVGGYTLSAALAASLAQRSLSWPLALAPRVVCLEFRAHLPEGAGHTPAVTRLCDSLRERGVELGSAALSAPPFWQAHEAPATPGLGRQCLRLIEGVDRG